MKSNIQKWFDLMESLHYEKTPYEKKKEIWYAKASKHAISKMEEQGIYDLPLKSRRGYYSRYIKEYEDANPPPRFSDFIKEPRKES